MQELAEYTLEIIQRLQRGELDQAAQDRDCSPEQLAAAAITEMFRQEHDATNQWWANQYQDKN
jgi:hypothetical protein